MRYTISEMAALLGVTTHTLRYYEKMGLIQPEVNRETGYRYYTVTDTRRFNLCRELRAAELSLEECRELIGAPTVEQSDAMFNHQIAQLRRRQVLDELAIRFLEHKREQYRTLEQNAGRIWVQNFPEMWRLTFSQEEAADRDKELQQEKAEWLKCMPATRWVSRLPRRVMEQFRVGRNEYDYGLLVEADAARQLGLRRTEIDGMYDGELRRCAPVDGATLPEAQASVLCEVAALQDIDPATPLSVYTEDYFAGCPAVAIHSYGAGRAYYLASRFDAAFYRAFYRNAAQETGLTPAWPEALPDGVLAARHGKSGDRKSVV